MPDPAPRVTLGILGLGPWGRRLASTFARAGRARIAWLCDLDAARLAGADVPGAARSTTRHEEVLGDRDLDAVVVATPPATHAELALAALGAGKHVFVEKPMATSLAAADELVGAVARSGRTLMVGHILTFHPGHVALQRWVKEESLGRVHTVVCQRWSPRMGRAADDAWWSHAVHDVSVLGRLLDADPVSVATVGERAPGSSCLGQVCAEFVYASGARALVEASTVAEKKRRCILVAAEHGVLCYDELERDRVRLYAPVDRARFNGAAPGACFSELASSAPLQERAVPPGEPLLLEASHFLGCLLGAAPPLCDVRDGWRAVRALEAAMTALQIRPASLDAARAATRAALGAPPPLEPGAA